MRYVDQEFSQYGIVLLRVPCAFLAWRTEPYQRLVYDYPGQGIVEQGTRQQFCLDDQPWHRLRPDMTPQEAVESCWDSLFNTPCTELRGVIPSPEAVAEMIVDGKTLVIGEGPVANFRHRAKIRIKDDRRWSQVR